MSIVRSLVLLALGLLVFATHSFPTLHRARVKLVEASTPHTAGGVSVASTLSELSPFEGPFALIARVANSSATSQVLSIAVDGREVCHRTVGAESTSRIDCAFTLPRPRSQAHFTIAGTGASWSLEYLEAATHHGNSDGLLSLVVLPATSTLAASPGLLSTLIVSLLSIAFIWRVPAASLSVWADRSYVGASVLIGVFCAMVLVLDHVSAYRVVVSTGTALRLLLVILLPQSATLWRALSRTARGPRERAWTRPALIAGGVALVFATVVQTQRTERYGGNYSGFLVISRAFFDDSPLMRDRTDVRRTLVLADTGGYDAQFAYYIAFDPFMRAFRDHPEQYRFVVDAVPYRYGRAAFSWLVRLFSMGQWPLFPSTMMALVVLATAVSAFCLALMAQEQQMSPVLGALVVVVPGFWQSVQLALPEPIAAALLCLGCVFFRRGRDMAAAISFAGALLIRETSLLFVACLAGSVIASGDWRRAFRLAALSIAPLVLWRGYVGLVLWPAFGWQGFVNEARVLDVPFAGLKELWAIVATGTYYSGSTEFARAAHVLPAVLCLGAGLSLWWLIRSRSWIAASACLYAAMALSLDYEMVWVHVGNAQRATYELFVVLALALVSTRSEWRPPRYALMLFWAATAYYTIWGSFDAAALREAAHLPL